MRVKESSDDYRYFPEPDLPPLHLDPAWLDALRAALPELPAARRARYVGELGLSPYDAAVLANDEAMNRAFEAIRAAGPGLPAKEVANLVTGDYGRALKGTAARTADGLAGRADAASLAHVLAEVLAGRLSRPNAKEVVAEHIASGAPAREIVAARGFALCRLDIRGTGGSPGIAMDEYAEAETLDGYDAVEWLAAQPWCNGNVGMWGISYGGFTSIQVAKLRPPHLRAILPMYATDDRYRDDVHLRGGCVTASEKSQYAVSQLGMNAMPPLPAVRGEGWRDGRREEAWRAAWLDRLEQTPPWLFTWIREQADGPYWRRGSLAPDYDALDCAVFQVAGWNDSYVDPAFRIAERCTDARVRTLVGNWVHSFPDDAYDLGPASFADIDPSLHEPGLMWGAAKAHVHLARRRAEGLR
jgi:putative CocE/NonD family hydrolase